MTDSDFIADYMPFARWLAIWWWIGRQYASRTEES